MNMSSYVCCENDSQEITKVDSLSQLLKIVGEPSRLKILCMLRQNEHCVCELIDHIKLSQSLISHHLQDLKESGIVVDEKRGSFVYYALTAKGRKTTDSIFQLQS